MSAFRHRLCALAVIAIASTAISYAQPGSGQAPRRDQSAKPKHPQAPGPEKKAGKRPSRSLLMPNAESSVIAIKHANIWEVHNALNSVKSATNLRALTHIVGGSSLLVTTDDEKALAKTREIVAMLDKPEPPSGPAKADVCVGVPLRNAAARELSDYLHVLSPKGPMPPRIVADRAANTVWIAGAKEKVTWLTDLAQKMDENAARAEATPSQGDAELRFHAIEHAETVELARTLTHIGAAMDLNITVVPNPASQTLLAYATPAEHTCLENIIRKLDVPAKQHARRRASGPRERDGG
jgi:type II secretory pathway component GspD/PulD (secretin)